MYHIMENQSQVIHIGLHRRQTSVYMLEPPRVNIPSQTSRVMQTGCRIHVQRMRTKLHGRVVRMGAGADLEASKLMWHLHSST